MKRRLVRSIALNYLGAIAAALGPLLVTPVYLRELGRAQWGMMSVALTVAALLLMVDGGLSQVLIRDFVLRSRRYGRQSPSMRSLLAACQVVYGLLAMAVALALALGSTPITHHWLKPTTSLQHEEAIHLLMMTSLLVAVQFFGALPRSLLLALDQHHSLNVSIAVMHLFRYGVGALIAVLFQSLQSLLYWYIAVALAECIVRYGAARRVVGMPGISERPAWAEMKALIPGGMRMSVAAVMSGLTTQLDKLILMKLVPLEQVGIYAIASTVALGVLSLGYPLIQAIFPRLVSVVHENKLQVRKVLLRWLAITVGMAAISMALYIWLGKDLLRLWLRDDDVATAVYPLLMLLLTGTVLNVIYQVGYMGWMLEANYRLPLIVNALSTALTLCLTPLLIEEHGVAGAAAGWLAINIIGLLTSLSWFRKFI